MIYVATMPRIPYYAWQLEVMLQNFQKHQIPGRQTHVLLAVSRNPADATNDPDVIKMFAALKEKFIDVCFFEYFDTRINHIYAPNVVHNCVKQHLRAYPEVFAKEAMFLHDPDMIFTKRPDFSMLENDDITYVSDTRGYIWADYILSKGEDLYNDMCDIVGIDKSIPIKFKNDSGGAQYVFKKTDYRFWHKADTDAELLYRYFQASEPVRLARDPNYYGIQQFTAGMWSMLWNIWYFDLEVKISPELDFAWGTDPIARWNDLTIFHNSGVTQENAEANNLFWKAKYNTNLLPYQDAIRTEFNPAFASEQYAKEIRETAKNSCLWHP